MESKWRKEGKTGKELTEMTEAWIQEKKKIGVVANKKIKSELKSVREVANNREALDRRREKTGRHREYVSRGGGTVGGRGMSSRGSIARGSGRGGSRGKGRRGSSKGGRKR